MAKGKKFDQEKIRYDLLDVEYEEAIAKVLTFGAEKYDADNWQLVPDFRARYYAAMRRHLKAWVVGEINDPETGLNHMAHIGCNAMFLFWKDKNADTNISRRESDATDSYTEPWQADSSSDDVNHDEGVRVLKRCQRELVAIYNRGGTYESFRTRLHGLLSRWNQQIITGTDNTPPNE